MTTKLRELCERVCKLYGVDSIYPQFLRALVDAVEQSGRGEPSRLELMATLAAPTLARGKGIHCMGPEAIAEICGSAAFCVDALTVQAGEDPAPITTPRLAAARKDSGTSDKPANPCTDCAGMCRGPGPADDCAHADAPAPLPDELRKRLRSETDRVFDAATWTSPLDAARAVAEHIYRLAMRDHNDWTSEEAREQFDIAIHQRDAAIARAEQAERELDTEKRRARAWQSAHDVECERRRQAELERDELRAKLATAEAELAPAIEQAVLLQVELATKLATATEAWRSTWQEFYRCADFEDVSPSWKEWLSAHPAPKEGA